MPRKPLSLMNCHTWGGRVVQHVAGLPLVRHGAQLFGLDVEEGLLLRRELRLGQCEKLVPVRLAAEQVAFPPHGSRLQRLALGLRHRWQDAAERLQGRLADQRTAQRHDVEQRRRHDINAQHRHPQRHRPLPQHGAESQPQGTGEGPQEKRRPQVGEHHNCQRQGEEPGNHLCLLFAAPDATPSFDTSVRTAHPTRCQRGSTRPVVRMAHPSCAAWARPSC